MSDTKVKPDKSPKEEDEDSDLEYSGDHEVIGLPQKKYFRQRAHVNPIADHGFDYPLSPHDINWKEYYPIDKDKIDVTKVRYLDVGCGFGGLLIALSPLLKPNDLALGMEIRMKVSQYVQKRIEALRSQNPGQYKNVWCIRTNAMRYIPNYIHKQQLTKMFILFPDPHFKRSKHKWRIISDALLAEYAYVCAIDAIIYIASDVEELFAWMVDHLTRHPLFEKVSDEEMNEDPMIKLITTATEESKKVARNSGQKYYSSFRRISDEDKTIAQ